MPTPAWLLVGRSVDQGRDRGSPGRFKDGRSWVRSIRGGMAPREWSGCAFGPAFGRRRLRRQSKPALVATQGDVAGPLDEPPASELAALVWPAARIVVLRCALGAATAVVKA